MAVSSSRAQVDRRPLIHPPRGHRCNKSGEHQRYGPFLPTAASTAMQHFIAARVERDDGGHPLSPLSREERPMTTALLLPDGGPQTTTPAPAMPDGDPVVVRYDGRLETLSRQLIRPACSPETPV